MTAASGTSVGRVTGSSIDGGGVPAASRVAVVVPTRLSRVRLLWLLDALAAQDLPADAVEIVLATDAGANARYAPAVAAHPLVVHGRARLLRDPALATAPAKREAAWRASDAPLVAFCDDDTRPPPSWLRTLVAAADAHPGAVVQGSVRLDEDERLVGEQSPLRHLLVVDPPTVWGETANLLYPRAVLARLGGFDPSWTWCEDTDLACRACAAGVPWVAAPQAWTRHGVDEVGLRDALRRTRVLGDLGRLVVLHPEVRSVMPAGVFWTHPHARFLAGVTGLAVAGALHGLRRRPAGRARPRRRRRGASGPAAPRRPPRGTSEAAARPTVRGRTPLRDAAPVIAAAVAWSPWVWWRSGRYGPGPRGRARALAEAPIHLLVDAAEVTAVVRGAARARTVLL